jgi:hypothetical protein
MFFILLGLGVAAFAAYELSPKLRLRVDDYARAIRAAHAAHAEADAHLANVDAATAAADQHAQAADAARQLPPAPPPSPPVPPAPSARVPPPPPPAPVPTVADAHDKAAQTAADAGIDHAAAGQAANQEAAKSTADAGKLAKTDAERQEVAQSAAKVLEREKRIAQALANLGVGQCGARTYQHVTPQVARQLLDRLHAEGMTVNGDNPWDIDTHQYDVRLRAVWDPKALVLKLIVTMGAGGFAGLVTCDKILEKIEPILKDVIGS